MLKQIVATSALMTIVAVAAQAASAADTTKFRELVIEPAAAQAESGNGDAKKRQRLLLLASEGTATADAGKGEAGHFVVAPIEGLLTPTDGGNKAKAKQAFPTLAKASVGIATPVKFTDAGADQTRTDASKAFPLIASAPEGLTTPADVSADAEGSVVDGATAVETKAAIPAAPKAAIAKAEAAPITAAPAPVAAVAPPRDLYTVLTGRGYGVEILKRDAHGNMVFYVTIPGNTKEADLLVVDSTYTKVIQRKHVTAFGYERPATYTPRYSIAYAGEDNCDRTAGY